MQFFPGKWQIGGNTKYRNDKLNLTSELNIRLYTRKKTMSGNIHFNIIKNYFDGRTITECKSIIRKYFKNRKTMKIKFSQKQIYYMIVFQTFPTRIFTKQVQNTSQGYTSMLKHYMYKIGENRYRMNSNNIILNL